MEKLEEKLKGMRNLQVGGYQAGYEAGYRAKEAEICKYSKNEKSVRCGECNDILCPACGYEKEGIRLCNECYAREKSPQLSKSEPPNDFKDDPTAKSWCGKCGKTLISLDGETGKSLCGLCSG